MIFTPKLSKKQYLSALRERMDSPFRWGSERCCGFFLGGLFSVTYHSGHEHNRRITGERNTALGFVAKDGEGCQVRFFVVKGLLAPHYLLGLFLLCLVICLSILLQDDLGTELLPYMFPISLVLTLLVGAASAVAESLTDRSLEGKKILHSILLDPTDPFSYLHNQPKL